MGDVIIMGQGSFTPKADPLMKGRVTIVSSAFNPETGQVEEVAVEHRYVECDMMTNQEISDAHLALFGAEITGMFDENRDRMKTWTGKTGFDFVTKSAK